MADFKIAFDRTVKFEGGYSNDPEDFGGETVLGISRVYNPNWEGWGIVDVLKPTGSHLNPASNPQLVAAAEKFYQDHYWNPMLCNLISDQDLANELFYGSVNLGVSGTIILLQRALNALNRNQKDYPDVVEDGTVEQDTITALEKCLFKSDGKYLLKAVRLLRGAHYLDVMKKKPAKEKWARGWFNTISI